MPKAGIMLVKFRYGRNVERRSSVAAITQKMIEIPNCKFCDLLATYLGPQKSKSDWAYMCDTHWEKKGVPDARIYAKIVVLEELEENDN